MHPISFTKLSKTLELSECNDGFWLFDTTRGMNLAMRAKSRDGAFTEALTYYQNRLLDREKELKELRGKVDSFLSQFPNEED